MDTRTFVANVVASLAWPVTTLIGLLLVRKIMVALIPLVRTLRYSDFEVSFGREVAATRAAADAADIAPADPGVGSAAQGWEELVRLADVRPRSAIREAWRRVESALTQAAKQRRMEVADGVWAMPMVLGSLMLNDGALSEAQYRMLSRLRQLVSEAERAPVDGISSEDAADFVSLALRLAASITVT